jgi:hypothetical protein
MLREREKLGAAGAGIALGVSHAQIRPFEVNLRTGPDRARQRGSNAARTDDELQDFSDLSVQGYRKTRSRYLRSVNSWGELFRRRTIASPNRIRTFNPRVNSRLLTSGGELFAARRSGSRPNRFDPRPLCRPCDSPRPACCLCCPRNPRSARSLFVMLVGLSPAPHRPENVCQTRLSATPVQDSSVEQVSIWCRLRFMSCSRRDVTWQAVGDEVLAGSTGG